MAMTSTAAGPTGGATQQEGALVRLAIAFTAWAERWFPDAFIFVAIAVVESGILVDPCQLFG